jgi:hypothetical protein
MAVRVVYVQPVRDVDEFCKLYAGNEAYRRDLGVLSAAVHRSVDNPNEVMVTFEVDSAEDALALFTSDDRIRAWMDRAGVDEYPAIFVGTQIWADST